MAEIDMLGGSGLHMEHTEESAVQHGGGGEIDMFGGSDLHMGHSPVGSEQKGGKGAGIDMVGPTDLINRHEHTTPYGSKHPTDKGE